MKTTCISLLIVAGTLLGARAEDFRTDINPALLYYRAFLLAPDLPQADSDYLWTNNWQGEKFPVRLNDLLGGYDNQFQLVRQAAHSSVACDWGIDMSPGPAATFLPQLARAKAVAQAARLRVPWHLQNGRQDAAREDLLAAIALGRNLSTDGTLISTLVQIAIEAIESSTIAANFGHFSPESLQQLAAGLNATPERRSVAESLKSETDLYQNSARRRILAFQEQSPGNDAKVLEQIRELLGFDKQFDEQSNVWQRVIDAAGGTSEGILRLLQEAEQNRARIGDLVKLPYREFKAQEPAFSETVKSSANPFDVLLAPGIIKARLREFRILATLTMVRAAIEYKLHGEPALQSIPDPCGDGPFAFRRFVFEGVDRGFELRSAFNLGGNQVVLIFVEKEGPAFQVDGNYPGRPLPKMLPSN